MAETDPLIPHTNATQLQHTRVSVQDVGRTVRVRNTVYSYTNHFIIQSRPYFRRNLPTYINCICFSYFAWIFFLASFLGILAVKGGYFKGTPFYCFVVCAVFIAVFSQHEVVNRRSLPFVLSQPVFDGQESLNALYELTITELQGLALQNYQAGIGFIHVSEGHVKFQAFNRHAVGAMHCARRLSRCSLLEPGPVVSSILEHDSPTADQKTTEQFQNYRLRFSDLFQEGIQMWMKLQRL
ncbi:unnamed protein product [Porites lobata]|uniref:Uncharacterized protein n=1 Tax=Porites lobata TaxID=104759 RepID=A0ABN8NXS0_9CNID|nr:unnamed protein product [Porites lobata]